ncbi:oxidoreductase [Heliorestis convoluta]|uniref:NAD-dependent epimerase/dehydratase family protein n=1 Tax=Heliorestis convoluta TaxID=356322 RepID=A0A5Q2MVY1_9FIRM|nr:oxidoreductase [Heliorestis convoluta]QGG46437.1 NAD-dependent epimerase/dehydratase family protein [Heliorestis convoluta]
MSKTALIAGATGLVGQELLQILLQGTQYEKIYAIGRRPLEIEHPKLRSIVCDFEKLDQVKEYFAVQDLFICLGTTIKKAKTKEAMYRVDVDYPLTIARLALEQGARHFLIISSTNANANSFFWYPRMKGILEEELQKIPYPSMSILQPALLLGDRKEFRLGEHVASILCSRVLSKQSPLRRKLAVEAHTVALAMCNIAQLNKKGIATYSNDQIIKIAKIESP